MGDCGRPFTGFSIQNTVKLVLIYGLKWLKINWETRFDLKSFKSWTTAKVNGWNYHGNMLSLVFDSGNDKIIIIMSPFVSINIILSLLDLIYQILVLTQLESDQTKLKSSNQVKKRSQSLKVCFIPFFKLFNTLWEKAFYYWIISF